MTQENIDKLVKAVDEAIQIMSDHDCCIMDATTRAFETEINGRTCEIQIHITAEENDFLDDVPLEKI